jgi:hypothetical protein
MNWIMVRFIKDNGQRTDLDMAVAYKFGRMVQNMKDIGVMI